jgi:hypothetical protein
MRRAGRRLARATITRRVGAFTVTLRLGPRARRLLAQRRRLVVTVTPAVPGFGGPRNAALTLLAPRR